MLCVNRFRQNSARFCKRYIYQNVNASPTASSHNASLLPTSTIQDDLLRGQVVTVKDNIVTDDHTTSAASLTLEKYKSPFDATVVRLLREHGARVTGGSNMDEFGMGSHSQQSHFGAVRSPYARGGVHLSPGGSSGGSAMTVASGKSWAALGTDTGGSVRLPAAYTGIAGFKPSYGLISRWGVIQYANSLDTVGILARETSTIRAVFSTVNRFDALDPTSLPVSVRSRITSSSSGKARSLRIGVPLEYNIAELSPPVKQAYISLLQKLQSAGHTLHPVSLPSTRLALSAYYILAPAEASSNLAKYDGIRYGYRPDSASDLNLQTYEPSSSSSQPLYASTRGAGFGPEVQRRILLGAYSLSAAAKDNYFLQAQRVRRLVQRDFDAVFARENPLLDFSGDVGAGGEAKVEGKVDVLLTPTAPTLPPTVEEVEQLTPVESYMNDVFTVPASLAGLPAISVPVPLPEEVRKGMDATDVTTAGIQVIGQFGDDDLVLDFAEAVEEMNRQ